MVHSRRRAAAIAAVAVAVAVGAGGEAAAQDGSDAAPGLVAAPAVAGEVREGFYRDDRGRTMQVSFDLGRRVWLGVGYAPRRSPSGQNELAPAAFDFGAAWDTVSTDGRTRYRLHVADGTVRLNEFGLDITGVRFDLSHRYEHPLVRVTTFIGEPARHDLYLNVGLYSEALHFETAPRGVTGEQALTLASVQGTLDLWQSADLRSYVRLRAGPGVEMRFGPWGDEARLVGFFPQATFEGNLLLGKRALQQLGFRVRGDFLRSVSWDPQQLPGTWNVDGEAAYEAILLAINDQPVSLRLAGQARWRDDARAVLLETGSTTVTLPGWEWRGTAGFRVSFFSPPVRRPQAQ